MVLLGKTPDEIKQTITELSMPAFTARQISDWLYRKRADTIEQMSNISLANRQKLSQNNISTGRKLPVEEQISTDGTRKYLFLTEKGNYIETVYIPDGERHTLCVSSQAGCKMNCVFCHTGKIGFIENLSASDILNQIYSVPQADILTNIVFMGMGEPLDNLANVLRTIEIITADYAYAWSPHRITLSTVGLIQPMKQFLDATNCHLAISLHSPFHDERINLVPAEKAFPFADIINELKEYDFAHQRRLSVEYILFDGINDTPDHARELTRILNGLNCRVNLIRFHEIRGMEL
ncbi:MAG: radical SAM protein, partial [Paludibacter sp.]|nr:radical SAM protein [Paludibacter sp.]